MYEVRRVYKLELFSIEVKDGASDSSSLRIGLFICILPLQRDRKEGRT